MAAFSFTLDLFALVIASLVVYRLWLAPLSRLPGPMTCALSRIPLMYHEFSGTRRLFIHKLHLRYGHTVRVAPDEVSFATREAAKEIYTSGGSGFDKSTFYSLFENFDTPNMFSTLEKGSHADRKKRFAERYSRMYVMNPDVSSVIQDHVDAFVSKVAESVGRSVDIYDLLHCFALDGISGHLFYPKGLHSLTNTEDREVMKNLTYSDGLRRAYCQHYFPQLWRLYSALTGDTQRGAVGLASSYVLDTSREGNVASHAILTRLRMSYSGSPSEQDDDSALGQGWKLAASECMDHLAAGIDTTGDGLCFLMHHLSLPSETSQRVQTRLHEELVRNPGAPVEELPYLDAVVKEGLRVYSPIPMSLPRVVPQGGRTVDGVFLPGGTIVSCQAYTLHRLDTTVFPDPEEFIPERWLSPEGATERNQLFFAFAAGGRGCIGKHLALLEMKLLLKQVYSTYRTRVSPEMRASMEQDDQTISSRPKGQKCLVVFEKFRDAV